MTPFAVVRERWRAVAIVAGLECLVAWSVAVWMSARIMAPLRAHPDGAMALGDEGSRVAIDVFARNAPGLESAAILGAAGVVAYALASVLLAAFVPCALAPPRAPRTRDAALAALRRGPALLALALVALVAYALCALVGWIVAPWLAHTGNSLDDARAPGVLSVLAWLPSAATAYAVHVWHDLARAHLAGAGHGAAAAARDALARITRSPRATLVAYAGYGIAGAALACVGLAASLAPLRAPPAVTAVLAVAQQLTLVACVCVRALWLARATSPWRDFAAESARPE